MAGFEVKDRRGLSTRDSGVIVARGAADVRRAVTGQDVADALSRGRQGPSPTDWSEATKMRLSRISSRRRTAAVGGGGGDVSFATQRPRDPMWYWRDSMLPYDIRSPEELVRLREWCRFIYRSDSTLSSVIDIYSRYPVLGLELRCKDGKLVDFYSSLLLDQLDYEDFLVDIGREYWCVGEAWPLGSFNEMLGVWEADELIDPDDVFVERSPFLRDPRYSIRLPETLRNVLRSGQPAWEYTKLMQSYPELRYYTGEDARMPVSSTLLHQYRFKGDTFSPRGIPILTRALRPAIQEEMLNAAQDAISDRLYTPLVLARLGASAQDLGTDKPWVPTPDDLTAFEEGLDAALAADFRVMVTHFATQMDTVFGRETMPNLDADFERLEDKKLQAFGLSKTALTGAGTGETYAADALNRDLVTQLLTTFQRQHKRLMRQRMLVVAEAQGHYDYEERGGKRYVVNEEVLVVDEDGSKRVEERPKLLIPTAEFASMNMRDDEVTRQFYEALRAAGVPISMRTRLLNVPVDLDDEVETTRDEQVRLAVEAQETRRETYRALKAKGLPIPPDLREDFDPKPINAAEISDAAAQQAALQQGGMGARVPQLGVDSVPPVTLAPTPDALMMPAGVPTELPAGVAGEPDPGGLVRLPRNQARPPESDEMRAGMPVAGSATPVEPGDDVDDPRVVVDGDGRRVRVSGTLIDGPWHVGRRPAAVDDEEAV